MSKKNENKDDESKAKVRFQRPSKSSNLTMGIVGLPNVGKSTTFNRFTKSTIAAVGNAPFVTIEPSHGFLIIEDPRIRFLEKTYKPAKVEFARLNIVDIAGLVKGASEGKGLGNQFLDNIRNVDGIFLVVRCFEDPSILNIEDSVDPIRDIQIIMDELRLKDRELIEKTLNKAQSSNRCKILDKKEESRINTLKRLNEIIDSKWINEEFYTADEMDVINEFNLLTTKNVEILANISAKHWETRKCNKHLKAVLDKFGDIVTPYSATHHISEPDEPFPEEFIKKIVHKGYKSLNLINYFTAGKDEVKSWTIVNGYKAPKAAGVIHSDFENYFMSAEVMEYDEFVNNPSVAAMKNAGKYLIRGKEYVVKDGDIIYFKSNPPKSGKK